MPRKAKVKPALTETQTPEPVFQESTITPREFREYVRVYGYDARAREMAAQIADADYEVWKREVRR